MAHQIDETKFRKLKSANGAVNVQNKSDKSQIIQSFESAQNPQSVIIITQPNVEQMSKQINEVNGIILKDKKRTELKKDPNNSTQDPDRITKEKPLKKLTLKTVLNSSFVVKDSSVRYIYKVNSDDPDSQPLIGKEDFGFFLQSTSV